MLAVAIGAAALMAACAESSITNSTAGSTTDATSDATSDTTQEPSVGTSSVPAVTAPFEGSTTVSSDQIDPGLKPYIDLAVTDLAKRLSIDATEVGVTSATLVEWPDSSLGCPQPGQQYTQVSTDGSQIVLTANGKTYRYNAGGSRTPFLCEPQPKATPTTGPNLTVP
jgi:hypothetical protein